MAVIVNALVCLKCRVNVTLLYIVLVRIILILIFIVMDNVMNIVLDNTVPLPQCMQPHSCD